VYNAIKPMRRKRTCTAHLQWARTVKTGESGAELRGPPRAGQMGSKP